MKNNNRNGFELVLVEWLDATTRNDVAVSFEEAIAEEPVKAKTIGQLLYKDEKKVVLSSFLFVPEMEGMLTGYKIIHVIPASVVKKIERLKAVK